MIILVVVDDTSEWPLAFPGVELVDARTYLSEPGRWKGRVTLFNLCRSYRYQGMGWYVSLLATARGHRPIPNVSNLRDIRSRSLVRTISEELDQLMQKSLASIQSSSFILSVYFGKNLARRHDRLARALYNLFQMPLLRARFDRRKDGWQVHSIQPIAAETIPISHRDFVIAAARDYFAGGRFSVRHRARPRYDMAILHDPEEESPPSDPRALTRFRKAAATLDIGTTLVTRDDYGRLAEYDALFIRATTSVDHYTYDFARRAQALGLVVIDDPQSIVRATNKVFLAELLEHHGIPHPKTLLVSKANVDAIESAVGLPCVLKQPDSAFSLGVTKAESVEQLQVQVKRLLEHSELVIAQQFLATEFDWRVGVLDRKPLFVCRYHMAHRHWQIVHRTEGGREQYGKVQPVLLDDAPGFVVRAAVKAANLIGDGLYGVDVKSIGKRAYVIEVNDNPNIEAGYEDRLLGDELYRRILQVFLDRIVTRRRTFGDPGTAPSAETPRSSPPGHRTAKP